MPYSVDSEQNKDNPFSPSQNAMETQLVYKISALESTLKGFMQRFDERFDRLQKEIVDRHTDMVADLVREETERKALDIRVQAIEKWQTVITTRIVTLGSLTIVAWTLFGQALQDFLIRTF